MRLQCGLMLLVMLAMALGRVKEKGGEKIRSLMGGVWREREGRWYAVAEFPE